MVTNLNPVPNRIRLSHSMTLLQEYSKSEQKLAKEVQGTTDKTNGLLTNCDVSLRNEVLAVHRRLSGILKRIAWCLRLTVMYPVCVPRSPDYHALTLSESLCYRINMDSIHCSNATFIVLFHFYFTSFTDIFFSNYICSSIYWRNSK